MRSHPTLLNAQYAILATFCKVYLPEAPPLNHACLAAVMVNTSLTEMTAHLQSCLKLAYLATHLASPVWALGLQTCALHVEGDFT